MKVPEDEMIQQQGSTIVEMLKAGSFVLIQNLVPKAPLQYKTTQALNVLGNGVRVYTLVSPQILCTKLSSYYQIFFPTSSY